MRSTSTTRANLSTLWSMVYRLCKTSASHEFGAEFTAPATGVIMYKPDQDAEGFPHNRFDRLRLPGRINDQNRTRFLLTSSPGSAIRSHKSEAFSSKALSKVCTYFLTFEKGGAMNSLSKTARAGKAIHVLGAILGVLLFSLSLFSQVNTGTISGVVQDSSGALIAGATVTVRNVDTGTARSVTSDEGGRYIVPVLPLGNYEVQAQQAGFQTEIRSGITLTVGREEVINLTLRVGQQTLSVTVTEAAPLVNTTTAEISGLVAEREVKELPLNGRSFDNLITLNPGAINYSALKSGPSVGSGEGAYFTVAGRRPLDNLFLLNGIEYTGSSNIGITPGGVSGQLLGIDAVRE